MASEEDEISAITIQPKVLSLFYCHSAQYASNFWQLLPPPPQLVPAPHQLVLSIIYKGEKWFNEWVMTVGFQMSEGGREYCNETSLLVFVDKLFSFCMV